MKVHYGERKRGERNTEIADMTVLPSTPPPLHALSQISLPIKKSIQISKF